MIELDHRAEQFLDSIRDEGMRSCQEIREKTRQQVEAAREQARREEAEKAARTVRFETARAEVQENKAMSQRRAEIRGRLASRREAILGSILEQASARLRDFAAGPDYDVWLLEGAAQLRRALGDGTVLYARPADLPRLEGRLPEGCTLAPDEAIRLGGLRGVRGDAAADDTLEARLERQKSWLLEHTGLSIAL